MFNRNLLHSSCLIISLCLPALGQRGACPAGFHALLQENAGIGVAFTRPDVAADHYLCADAAGNLLITKGIVFAGSFLNARSASAAVATTVGVGSGITALTNAAARTVTLTVPTAAMNTLGVVGLYTIVDAAGTGSTANITITPSVGTVSGAANVKITTNFGVWQGFCTNAACFTLNLR